VLSLFFRNLLFTILQPGVVAGAVPWLIARGVGRTLPPDQFTLVRYYAGLVIAVAGALLTFYCIYLFMTVGRGTLSPADPTRRLVDRGAYRWSRNPMYIGILAVLAGQMLYTGYWELGLYALVIFGIFHLFVVRIEEPRLRRDFGEEYARYGRQVNRWLGRKRGGG
jgi:protein-S-isoprenylcysteine O-methyltransferase Ste14